MLWQALVLEEWLKEEEGKESQGQKEGKEQQDSQESQEEGKDQEAQCQSQGSEGLVRTLHQGKGRRKGVDC